MKVLISSVIISQIIGVYFNWLVDGVIQFSEGFAITQVTLLFIALMIYSNYKWKWYEQW